MREKTIEIRVPGSAIDVEKWSDEQVEQAVHMLDGVLHELRNGGYITGFRNTMAVDLGILCYVLRVSSRRLIAGARDMGWLSCNQWSDLCDRLDVIDEYACDSRWGDKAMQKMIDPDHWCDNHTDEDRYVMIY